VSAGHDRFTAYDPFAWLYATHWGAEYHEQALAVLQHLILHQLSPGAAILDLCCGDGRLAQVLDWRGFHVVGLDGSERMLEFARERCPHLDFVAGDARSFQLERKFDAVISTFDALNHVMSPDDLAEVCRRVHEALKPTGYFAFDLNREEAYVQLWAQTAAQVEPEMVSISVGSYDAPNRTAHCDITLFRLYVERWMRSDFRLSEYCHHEQDVLNSLYAAGFIEAKVFDASTDLGMYGNIGKGRSYFLARRGI
jgi:SAM-dependent methyltransferase